MESSKVYVNVMAEFTKDGRLLPRSFIRKDGQIYEIQRVTDVRRAASLKAGGVGIRYTCIVNGRESHLFYEDNNMWFMEERQIHAMELVTQKDQREVHGINGADFGTSELICPFNIIINGFHFPYPLNGSNKPGGIN